ncbi:alpha-tocopherol transfer protein-like isoform X1 [Culex pipiens pallens]|uniref:alpha-tocopherol transfer protein-like isoform X1 n=1 Tax=Culex pipiens pallens TaxID=42434 RepID=UPI001954C413|nr:alpha-tocopherol transfer protein-like isoform X1 [Culex pipiens pallens]
MKTLTYPSVEEQYRQYRSDVQVLIEWLQTQPHLPEISEYELILFLHSNYYEMEATKKTIEAYYTFRTTCKDMFVDKDVCSAPVQQAMDITAITTLPKLTQENYRVIFAKIIDTDASKFVLPTIFKFGFTCVDIDIWENGCSEGYVLIIDTKTLHIGHLPKIGLFTVKNFVYYIQEALPLRLKAVHFINMVPMIERILAMARPFLKKELLEMIHFHTNVEGLFPFIPQRNLPVEYGGDSESLSVAKKKMDDKVMELRDFILSKELTQRIDESKRIKTKSLFNLFGAF